MRWSPSASELVVMEAWPLPFSATVLLVTPAGTWPLSVKVTVPEGTGLPPEVTVAVKVVACVVVCGFWLEASAVVVGLPVLRVSAMHQPPFIVSG